MTDDKTGKKLQASFLWCLPTKLPARHRRDSNPNLQLKRSIACIRHCFYLKEQNRQLVYLLRDSNPLSSEAGLHYMRPLRGTTKRSNSCQRHLPDHPFFQRALLNRTDVRLKLFSFIFVFALDHFSENDLCPAVFPSFVIGN